MKTNSTLSITAATSLACGLLLLALGSAWGAGMMKDSKNNQEKLTPAEQAAFSRLDSNGDGKISQSEASKNPLLAKKFTTVDRDANQQLDEGEFARFEMESQPHKNK